MKPSYKYKAGHRDIIEVEHDDFEHFTSMLFRLGYAWIFSNGNVHHYHNRGNRWECYGRSFKNYGEIHTIAVIKKPEPESDIW
jgi:hypothetical protein